MYPQHPTPAVACISCGDPKKSPSSTVHATHPDAPIPASSSCTCTAPRQRTKHNVFAVDSARQHVVNPSQTLEFTVHAGGTTLCVHCAVVQRRPATIITTSAGAVSSAIRVRIHLFSHYGHPRTDKLAPSHHSVRTCKPHMH
jgi:hypothetical protein